MKLFNHAIRFSCLWVIWIMITGCGGSGSGGFDTPTMTESSFKAEQSTIEEVTREGSDGRCVKTEGTLICPTDAPLPPEVVSPETSGLPSGNELPITLSIIGTQSRSIVTCDRTIANKGCKLTVRMRPEGFPQKTRFVVATHLKDSSIWTLGSDFERIPSDPSIFEVVVQFKRLPSKDRPQLQIVVLVYLPDKVRPQSDTLEPLLSHFQADAVFVVAGLTIEVKVVDQLGRIEF